MNRDVRREFKVESPQIYDAYPLTAPEGELHETARRLRAEMLATPPEAKPKSAVWVVHGMGQQVPFETLEQVAEGIIRAAGEINVADLQYREVRVGSTVLQRVELMVNREKGPRQVDIYECYWAPKTEGAVKLRDVIDFLWNGGSRGLLNCFIKFQRAMFGSMTAFNITWRTPTYLLVTLATLAALMVINAVILATGATLAGIGQLPAARLVEPLTAIAGLVCAAAITFGAILVIAEATKPLKGNSLWGRTIRNLTWVGVAFTVLDIVAGATIMSLIFWKKLDPAWLHVSAPYLQTLTNVVIFASLLLAFLSRLQRRRRVSRLNNAGASLFSPILFYVAFIVHVAVIGGTLLLAVCSVRPDFATSLAGVIAFGLRSWMQHLLLGPLASVFGWHGWVWPFLVIVSGEVRMLLVEYVGDVTAYVASNKLDRFDELRAKIKALGKESLSAVYSAKPQNSNEFEYDDIHIVGHSLGSVIAYDTLNCLIADDALAGDPARVVGRTRLLLTFGSPLDKTAFFFSVIGKTTRHIREQLAAVVQPLIESRPVRKAIEWVNVYSRNDIISGPLNFYEFPEPLEPGVVQVRKVVNVKDNDALVPLVAHVDYWSNRKVWDELVARL
jgi:hypothetical protein